MIRMLDSYVIIIVERGEIYLFISDLWTPILPRHCKCCRRSCAINVPSVNTTYIYL